MRKFLRCSILAGLAIGLSMFADESKISRADEGMWLFNAVPKAKLKADYSFEPTQEWLDRLMLSSVRFNSGGSASFVSSNGLVLTNHHVASDTLYKLSTPEKNYHEHGFLAETQADEIKTPDLELNQLISIEDVTAKVNEAVKPSMTAPEAAKARQSKMASLEQESLTATGLRSDVVTLYGGGRYHLYRYKKYTDVRLVWAPEAGSAFFGGDADNFEYPRFCLDVTLFRVYEDGKPAKIQNFLKMDPNGAREKDLVFVSGNPGRTRRIFTHDAIEYQRDIAMPRTMNLLRRREILMQQYAIAGPEQQRRAKDDLFGIQNSRKANNGILAGIQDPSFTATKKRQEAELISRIGQDPKLAPLASSWEKIRECISKRKELVTKGATLRSKVYGIAETLNLMASEDRKSSGDRLREFRDSNRASLTQSLFSDAPIYQDLERMQLADELSRLIDDRGANDPLVVTALAGKSPRQRATELIAGTKLFQVEERRRIAEGGTQAISESKDSLIVLAKSMESEYRRVREATESLDEQERQAYSKVTEAKFAVGGDSVYPDATFTLRLAYGKVAGYETDGKQIPAQTTLGGAFSHEESHLATSPWVLPKSWHAAKEKLKSDTPFNFVCTADIIGGNSGSPVVSRDGNMVGIIFDGNIESLTADFYYTDNVSRAVAVHIAGVLESLRTIYHAPHLADEMGR